MITVFLDSNIESPLYEQLYSFIKKSIENNELKSDEKLPSKRKLAQHLKVSVITIENAYNQLVAEGYIKSKAKSGFYVMPYIRLHTKRVFSKEIEHKKIHKDNYRIDFRTNQVDANSFPYGKFAKIEREVMQFSYAGEINTTDYQGNYSLRKKISELLFEYRGVETSPESIVIGSGSEHLISLLVLLIGRDRTYGVEEPGYLKNYHLYLDYGATAKTIALDEQGVDITKCKDIDIIHTTPSHQFPKGIVTTIQRRMELLNWASEKNNRYIIEDDYDSEFRFSGIPIPAMKSLDTLDKVIYMNSFSKSISPSFRVSFMVLPERLMHKYHESYSYFTCSVPVMTQLVLERFITNRDYEKHLNRMRNIYKNKRDYLVEKLKKSSFGSQIEIIGAESGLHFLMKITSKTNLDDLLKAAKAEGVRLYGIHEYKLSNICLTHDNIFVLGYSHLCEEDFDEAVAILEKAWKKLL